MKRILLIAAACCAVACTSQLKDVDAYCSGIFHEGEPGAAILVKQGDRILFEKCYGIADIETKAPVTPQTSFNIASVSKQFTATAVMQLAEQGKLQLTDRVQKYFPEYTDPIWQKIEIRHLLCHSSGIPDKRDYPREVKIKGDDNLALEYMQTLDTLNFEPGTGFEYINPTYVLLGRLVERVSGEEFEEYMRKHIFEPAGMMHTLYFGPEKEIEDMAHAYSRGEKADGITEWEELDYGEDTFFATRPDGGIYTSLEDLSKWVPALLAGKIVSPAGLEALWTKRSKMDGDDNWYGYGWGVMDRDGKHIIYHNGGNGCFRSLEVYYPEADILLLILANRSDFDREALWAKIEEQL